MVKRVGPTEYGGQGGIIQPRSGATKRGTRPQAPGDVGGPLHADLSDRTTPVDALNGHDELTAAEQRMVLARVFRAEANGLAVSYTEVRQADGSLVIVKEPITEAVAEEELRSEH